MSCTLQIKCVCITASDFLAWFVRIVSNEGFTSLVTSIENDTGTTNNVLFEQLINIFILWIKEMKSCRRIGDGIETDSHSNKRDKNGLMSKVNTNDFYKINSCFQWLES